jgi:hypothetical protein
LLTLPDDVLRGCLRPYLCTEDKLNVMEVIGFKVPLHAPISTKRKMVAISLWTETQVKKCTTPKVAELMIITLELFEAVGKDVLNLQPNSAYLRWKTQMIQTIDNNLDVLVDQLYGLDYHPHLSVDDLSLTQMISRLQKLKHSIEKNETYQHRRRIA